MRSSSKQEVPMALFTIVIELGPESKRTIGYDSIKECLDDVGLRTLFDNGMVVSAQIRKGSQRVAALPEALVSWKRFEDQVVSNSTTLLRTRP
jgi:hypothetical protein